jgi:hypothetical protein
MIINEIKEYNGALLHSRFAYRYFRDRVSPLGNIIAFRGPMEVLAEQMIDQEDLLAEAFIWSDDAINFLWEIPLLGDNSFGAVAYQRLFNTLIADILAKKEFLNTAVHMRGDDIYVLDGKCSVSITHVKNHAALGHTGINIEAGSKAPDFAYSTKLSDLQAQAFMECVIKEFYSLNQDIFTATSKIISV